MDLLLLMGPNRY